MKIIIDGIPIGIDDEAFKNKKAAFIKNITKSLSSLEIEADLLKEKLSETYDIVNPPKGEK